MKGIKQVVAFACTPLVLAGVVAAGWNNKMKVGMIIPPSAVGMQHTGKTDVPTKFGGTGRKVFEYRSGHVKHGVIYRLRLNLGHRSQLKRQSKGHHKVMNGQQLSLLSDEPIAGGAVLALRATAVATGEREFSRMGAVLASPATDTRRLTATGQHGLYRLVNIRRDARSVVLHKGIFVLTQNIDKETHTPHSHCSTRPSAS